MTITLKRINSRKTEVFIKGKFLLFARCTPEKLRNELLASGQLDKTDKIVIVEDK